MPLVAMVPDYYYDRVQELQQEYKKKELYLRARNS